MRLAGFWTSCAAPRPLRCSPRMVSACLRRSMPRERPGNELGGVLVDRASGSYRFDAADRDRDSHRLLADLLTLALEISGRGRGRASDCSATDGAWFLCPGSTRFTESTRPLVGIAHRPHAGLHFRRVGDRVFVIQSALRRATFRRIVLPLSKAGLVTGFALSFAHTLGEFGVVLMVGGNIPGVTRTISIDIY